MVAFLTTFVTFVACAPPAAPPAETEGAPWAGTWLVTWERPDGWRPPAFHGHLGLEQGGATWTATLRFDETSATFAPRSVDIRGDVARLAFGVADGGILSVDLLRDGEEVHGTAKWTDAGGVVSVRWSPVSGKRASTGGGPLVPAGLVTPWTPATPAEVGLDEVAIRAMVAGAEDAAFAGFVLVKGDRLVVATGPEPTARLHVASVSKALSSLAVPYLLAEGKWPSLDASIAPALGWAEEDPRAALTLRHVLTHSTGLETPEYRRWFDAAHEDYREDLRGATLTGVPGAAFAYSNRTFELVSEVVSYASGESLDAWLSPRLLVPVGVEATWVRDTRGHAQVHAGVGISAVDLAKVGAVLAADGVWQGRQVLPAGWVRTATATGFDAGPRGQVGLGWFLMGDGGFQHTGDSGAFLVVRPADGIVAAGVHRRAGPIGTLVADVAALTVSR